MVSADPSPDLRLVSRVHRRLEPLHSQGYFAPELEQGLTALGVRPGRMAYFAGRAAPMGAVGAGVVTATFYNFAPALVARHVPRCWTLASPEQVLAARHDAALASLTRLLGDGVEAEVAELGDLLAEACAVLTPEGRPLYAAHADLPWPTEPVLRLWHAVSLLREHRGDGHIAVLVAHGLTGLEALVTHTLTGRGFLQPAALATRGWSELEWDAAVAALAGRGLVADGALTDAGQQLRAALEQETDALSAAPFTALGAERTERVGELAAALTGRVVANGAFPARAPGRALVTPRLPWSTATGEVADRMAARRGGELAPLDRLLLHAPPVADGWNAMLGAVRERTSLPADVREVVICAIAVLNGADYEWADHAPLARAAGVTEEQLDALHTGAAGVLTPLQQLAVDYATALTRDVAVDDELFARVRGQLDERGVVDLTVTVGAYNMVSRFLVALRLTAADREDPPGGGGA